MAYISQDDKAKLAPAIKAVLKKYNMKGSIGIKHFSTLVVNIQSGPIDFGGTEIQVNHYHVEHSERYSDEAKAFLLELIAAMYSEDWRDNSDLQSDYFDVSYYLSVNIGNWNKPYVCTALATC